MKKIISAFLLIAFAFLCLSSCAVNDEEPSCENSIFTPAVELTSEIEEYMFDRQVCYDLISLSLGAKIDRIRDGWQAFYLDFKASETYFVAAYHTNGTEHGVDIKHGFDSCDEEYLWVGFSAADIIPEYYEGKKIVSAFQINTASVCNNFITGEDAGYPAEHFQELGTEFVDGVNVANPIEYNARYILIREAGTATVYTSLHHYYFEQVTIECAEVDGKVYCDMLYYTIDENGERTDHNIEWQLGKYYDELMPLLIADQHVVTSSNGDIVYTTYHALLEFEVLRDLIQGTGD